MAKPLVSELHHWWPKTVSKYWANTEGCVHRLSSKGGEPIKSPPKSFGAIRNDNHIKFAAKPTDWDQSFEKAFHSADSSFAQLIDWLLTFKSATPVEAALMARLEPHPISDDRHAMLAECLASLIIRSPNFRHRVRLTVDGYREGFGLQEPANKNLIGMNVQHSQKMLSACFVRRGKFVVMRASEGEFIFGDGFHHTISSSANEPYAPRCLVPLTPEMAIFYTAPSSYISYPKFFVMNLSKEDVAGVNFGVQVYSRDEIFYRSIPPVIDNEFKCGEFKKFTSDLFPGQAEFEKIVANGRFPADKLHMPKSPT